MILSDYLADNILFHASLNVPECLSRFLSFNESMVNLPKTIFLGSSFTTGEEWHQNKGK